MIRPARPADTGVLIDLISELARYEKLEHQMRATASALEEHLFGANPAAEALVAEESAGGPVVGYALFFPIFSTFEACPCLYLEDLYVTPGARGRGLGKALLAAVAGVARERGCPRLDWNVLAWNEPAIAFYQALGAEVMPDWRVCRIEGDSLRRMASGADRID